MKSNKTTSLKLSETRCFYCGNIIDRLKTKKRDYCSDACRIKYWKGINKRLWKKGDRNVMPDDKP